MGLKFEKHITNIINFPRPAQRCRFSESLDDTLVAQLKHILHWRKNNDGMTCMKSLLWFPFIGLVGLQEVNEQSSVGASGGELLRAAQAGCIKKTHTMHKHQITP